MKNTIVKFLTLIALSYLTFSGVTSAQTPSAPPALTATSTAEDIVMASQQFAQGITGSPNESDQDAFVQLTANATPATLIAAYGLAPATAQGDNGQRYRNAKTLLRIAVIKHTTSADIPALLDSHSLNIIMAKENNTKPWTDDPKVTEFLVSSLAQWQAGTYPDSATRSEMRDLLLASQDPKVFEALTETITKLCDKIDSPAVAELLQYLSWSPNNLGEKSPERTKREDARTANVILALIKSPDQKWNRFTVDFISRSLNRSADLAQDSAFDSTVTAFLKSQPADAQQPNLALAYLGDPDALAKILANPQPNAQSKRFINTIRYAGPDNKQDTLRDHASDAVFQSGHWALTMPGFSPAPATAPPPTPEAAPAPTVNTAPAATPTPHAPAATSVTAPVVTQTAAPSPVTAPAPVKCTITAALPLEAIGSDGVMTGVTTAVVGKSYQCLRVENGEAVLKDDAGTYKIKASAVNQTPETQASPAPTPTPDTAPAPVATPTATIPAPSGPTAAIVNAVIGANLFSSTNLWDEKDSSVGIRLGWPQDGNSSILASYRMRDERSAPKLHMNVADATDSLSSPAPDTSVTSDARGSLINFFKSHSYSSTLYTRNGHPDFLSFIFANYGETDTEFEHGRIATTEQKAKEAEVSAAAVKRDHQFLDQELTKTFGPSTSCTFGPSGSLSMAAHRWDWNGTTFILTGSDRLANVIICPTAFADHHGIREDRLTTRESLLTHVKTAPNGDVTITDIPSVNQGAISYCTPATCEKYARYLDIPGDMFIFASLFETQAGGETGTNHLNDKFGQYLEPYGATLRKLDDLNLNAIATSIDHGQPLIWNCWLTSNVENQARARNAQRPTITDDPAWSKYKEAAQTWDNSIKNSTASHVTGHTRLIVGYNKNSGEIGYCDSDGFSQIHWITISEAQYIHKDYLAVIDLR